MSDLFKLNLQLFGEGGDGGAPSGEGSEAVGEDVPSSIPERARETYKKAVKATRVTEPTQEPTPEPAETPQKMSYADLIKSDDYKEEHKAYMDKVIQDRFKKYKGLEEKQSKSDELLSVIATKYELDPAAEDFLDRLTEKVNEDDSYYEEYAMNHDITTEEAKHIASLERRVAMEERRREMEEQEKAEAEQRAKNDARLANLRANAEITKQRFPGFDLDTEMRDPKFFNLCLYNNDDTTSAYMACHWNELFNNAVQSASQQAQIQTANAIASGKTRPAENGLSTGSPVIVETDFSKMNKAQLRAYAEEQRRLMYQRR